MTRPPRRSIPRAVRSGIVPRAAAALALATTLRCGAVAAAPHVPLDGADALELQSAALLEALDGGRIGTASALAAALARRHPRFALGQLLHAELSAAAAFDGTLIGSAEPWSAALVELLLEARTRLEAARQTARAQAPPAALVQLGPHTAAVVFVDLAAGRLMLYRRDADGTAARVREHYVASGIAGFGKRREGDRKTPLGLYRIDGALDDATLPELYGSGALTLDYPNALDRLQGRTGHGIWLHGVPRARASRGPRSSEGCVTMANGHLDALRDRLDPTATLVVLAGDARAASPAARAVVRRRHRALFDRYRAARLAEGSGASRFSPYGGAPLALGAAAREALAAAPLEALTIVESEAFGDAPATLVTEIALDADGIGTLALWWTREGDGPWRLALERNLVHEAAIAALKDGPAGPITSQWTVGHARPADAGATP